MGEYFKQSSSSDERDHDSPQTAISPELVPQQRAATEPLTSPDTERSQPLDSENGQSNLETSSRVASEFSGIKNRPAPQPTATGPAPARELDVRTLAEPLRFDQSVPAQEGGHHTTLQSMIRPDLLNHGMSDPRRFLSIERELSENSAATRFLEKRLNRAEKDSRVALALAGLALLLAVLSYVL